MPSWKGIASTVPLVLRKFVPSTCPDIKELDEHRSIETASPVGIEDGTLSDSRTTLERLLNGDLSIDVCRESRIVRDEDHRPELIFRAEPAQQEFPCGGQHIVEGAVEN